MKYFFKYRNIILFLIIDLMYTDLAKFIYSKGVSINHFGFST